MELYYYAAWLISICDDNIVNDNASVRDGTYVPSRGLNGSEKVLFQACFFFFYLREQFFHQQRGETHPS